MSKKLNLRNLFIKVETVEELNRCFDFFEKNSNFKRIEDAIGEESILRNWPYLFIDEKINKCIYTCSLESIIKRNYYIDNYFIINFKNLPKRGFKIPKIKVPKWKKIWKGE